ncbi:MAG: hypothetical protein H7Y20_01805 [Bryobacteraceae bacterium]|nr:hypothetical protein [Bryobacteraceae bacterium]
MKKILRITGGIGLVLLGITGIILPIMPGWIFLIPGLLILAEYFPPVARLVDWAKAKYESSVGNKWKDGEPKKPSSQE